ncbi:hypothetical protein DTO013E5_2143 [Penicillium roqueforti]|uniref:uncharacterized protein n=1 Tax=Penicillium roqueforti TaxID=5082 RepID=UPI00190B3361|nr:uncharacterized protein LCP9604111_1323 [Penicillium roqueforti]KAF9253797.1 hypothetical protein LCP9604111_1323 [Penicillium roqueforti]KAI1835428.1 hypothetical protein CBS147337_3451 [Penicillium roqueforti]KAI2687335.1 hypothetical protein LCP963914a_3936 [Penicillium roqueforti]KAI2724645.1 hypothetical protein CBS147318_1576 [Penicillium roqueforti]KAI2737877.1 hypothetical protein DTO012A1_7192 [Penicillium roqueforti]
MQGPRGSRTPSPLLRALVLLPALTPPITSSADSPSYSYSNSSSSYRVPLRVQQYCLDCPHRGPRPPDDTRIVDSEIPTK